jgi:hypothetical protein
MDLSLYNKKPYKWWEDEGLIAELDKRSADLKSGKDKGILWEDAKRQLLKDKDRSINK